MSENNEAFRRAYIAIAAAITSAKTIAGRERIKEMEVYDGCVEPGYDDGIWVIGNWNDLDFCDRETNERHLLDNIPSRLANVFDKMDGIHLHWTDMMSPCFDCQRLFLTTGDCHGWLPSFIRTEDGLICLECADAAQHFEDMEGKHDQCNQVEAFDPGEHEYIKLMEFERGMNWGKDADPGLIGTILDKAGFSRYIFNMDSTGQFDFEFSVWLHKDEAGKDDGMGQIQALRALEEGKTNGPSVAGGMERALKEASRKSRDIDRGDGVIVNTVYPDGTAEVKVVSQEDFLSGKALD